jgi:lysophospholipid acyltransferase (LPLAT)-like uncharacterized protein
MWKSRLALALGPRFASGFIRLLRRLMRLTWVNEDAVLAQGRSSEPYVHAFFHDQLLMMPYSYHGARFGRRLAVLTSRHRDGEYVSRTLERFGHVMVRGSSGRGGADGLRQMVRQLRAGMDGAIAVDGPRGPRHHAQAGAIEAARLGRVPVIPVAFAAGGKKNSVPGIASRSLIRSGGASSSTAIRSGSRRTPIAA